MEIFYDTDPALQRHHLIAKPNTLKLGKKVRQIYHFTLDKLLPNATYYFTLGNPEKGFSPQKKFHTLALHKNHLRFVEGGDFEVTKEAKELAKQAATYNPDAILLGGDYPHNIDSLRDYASWDAWLDTYTSTMVNKEGCLIPMVLAIGNHDVIGGYNQTAKNSLFYLPYFLQNSNQKSYFLKQFSDSVVLFFLDSGHIASFDGEQAEWLKKNLAAYQNIPVKFALYHVPLYPSVRFANKNFIYRAFHWLLEKKEKYAMAEALYCPQSSYGQKYWLPLFETYHLTTAFEHHDQALKRTKLLLKGEKNDNGILYLGDGGWGAVIRYPPIQRYFSFHFAKSIGYLSFFWLVDIDKDEIRYQAITKTGQVVDRYTQKLQGTH